MAVHVLACQLWLQAYTSVHQENCMTDPSVHKDIAQRLSPALLQYWHLLKNHQILTACQHILYFETAYWMQFASQSWKKNWSCHILWVHELPATTSRLLGQCSDQLYGQEHTTHAWWVSLSVLNAWKPHIAIAFKSCRLGTCISSGLFPWITIPVSHPITLNSYRLATCVLSYYPELL